MKLTITTLLTSAAIGAGMLLPAQASEVNVREVWSKHCLTCHGKEGRGDTKAGQKAKVKDLTKLEIQKAFSDDKAFASIKDGLKDGDKELMKPFHDKLSDDEVRALVAFVRTLGPK